MRRYLVFAGDTYYPAGGWDDFYESFDTLTDALDGLIHASKDWGQIVDSQTGTIVKRYTFPTDGQIDNN